jgi:Chaperone of endosialidase
LRGRTVSATQPNNGQVLKFNAGTSQWEPANDETGSGGGGGDISAVNAGTGLTGGGTSGDVTLGIANGGVNTAQLADGSVSDSKIVSVSGAKVTGAVANATNAVTATNSTHLGGVPASSYLQTDGNGSALTNLNASSITAGTLSNGRLGQIPTANIADNAVTAPKIASGQVVRSINTLKDDVTLAAGTNVTLATSGNTLTISSTGGSIGGSGTANRVPRFSGPSTLGDSSIIQSGSNIGIGTTTPSATLHVQAVGTTIRGASDNGLGVFGTSGTGTGVVGTGAIGVTGNASFAGTIALKADGSAWFRGDTTALSAANTGPGEGIVVGSVGGYGYIAAWDYGVFQARNLVLNRDGGSVGVGTSSPQRTLHVNGRARIGSIPIEANTAQVCMNDLGDVLRCGASSFKWKKNIQPFRKGLDVIRKLQPISYDWKEGGRSDFGLGAEDVAEVDPSLSFTNEKGEVSGVRYEKLPILLINAVKEQQDQIEKLQNEIAGLKALVCSLTPGAKQCEKQKE